MSINRLLEISALWRTADGWEWFYKYWAAARSGGDGPEVREASRRANEWENELYELHEYALHYCPSAAHLVPQVPFFPVGRSPKCRDFHALARQIQDLEFCIATAPVYEIVDRASAGPAVDPVNSIAADAHCISAPGTRVEFPISHFYAAVSVRDLLKIADLPADAGTVEKLEKRLQRLRSKNPESFIEMANPEKNKPRYLYLQSHVMPTPGTRAAPTSWSMLSGGRVRIKTRSIAATPS